MFDARNKCRNGCEPTPWQVRDGFTALISVVVLAALLLLIGVGLLTRTIGDASLTVLDERAIRAHLAATHCAEYALRSLQTSLEYQGNQTLTLPNGDTCRILQVTGYNNLNRGIQTTSTVMATTRKFTITIQEVHPIMRVTSWQEVANF